MYFPPRDPAAESARVVETRNAYLEARARANSAEGAAVDRETARELDKARSEWTEALVIQFSDPQNFVSTAEGSDIMDVALKYAGDEDLERTEECWREIAWMVSSR